MFSQANDRGKLKLLKKMATTTPHDKIIEYRQKNGCIRFGDIICLSFLENIEKESNPEIESQNEED